MRTEKFPWWFPKRFKQEAIAFDIAERKWVVEQEIKFWTKTWPQQQWEMFYKEPIFLEYIQPGNKP